MIAQSAFRAAASPAPDITRTPARQPARDADALLGALLYNWSIQRIALTLTLPAKQLATTERLVARLRKDHELVLQPLSLTVLHSEAAAEAGLTARIRFDYAMTPARIQAYLAKTFPCAAVTVKADASDRQGRSFLISVQD